MKKLREARVNRSFSEFFVLLGNQDFFLFLDDSLFLLFGLYQEVDSVECEDVEHKQENHGHGINDRVAAHQVVDQIIGSAVATHQEHVVVVQELVGDCGASAEAKKNCKREGNILLFHAGHSRNNDVER